MLNQSLKSQQRQTDEPQVEPRDRLPYRKAAEHPLFLSLDTDLETSPEEPGFLDL